MTPRRRKIASRWIAAMLVLLGGAIVWFWTPSADTARRGEPEPAAKSKAPAIEPEADRLSESSPEAIPVASPEATPGKARELPSLPEATAPLAEQLPVLIDLAERGHPVAACRLAISKTLCTTEINRREFASRVRRSLISGRNNNEEAFIDSAAEHEEFFSEIDGFCDGVDPDGLPSVDQVLRASVAALSPRQKTLLAMMRSDGKIRRLRPGRPISELDHYLLPQLIADHGYDFLLAGYAAKDPLALEGLILVHAPGMAIPPQGVSIRLPNPRLFLRYALVYARLHGVDALGQRAIRLVKAAQATLSPAEWQQLREDVDAEARRWIAVNGISRPDAGAPSPAPERPSDRLERCEG